MLNRVDLVYLWVDGSDQIFLNALEREKRKINPNKTSIARNRFRSCEELKYSLRSILKNASWIDTIFIVTNGQRPLWLKETNKIKIVAHSSFMPTDSLPTFNSEAIEANLWRIAELSEYFILANDDCFINKKVDKDFFFDERNNPIVRLCEIKRKLDLKNDLYAINISYSCGLFNNKYKRKYLYEPVHNIEAFRKSLLKKCYEEFEDSFKKTTLSKFRTPNCVQRVLYNLFMLEQGCALVKVVNDGSIPSDYLYTSCLSIKELNELIKKVSPVCFCLNDEPWVCDKDNAEFEKFLANLFPEPNSYESTSYLLFESPEKNKNAIVFCPDENYIKYTLVSLISILENTEQRNFDIIFVTDMLSEQVVIQLREFQKQVEQKIYIYNAERAFFNLFNGIELKKKSYWTHSMYYKCLIPLVFEGYQNILYLDSDIIVKGDIKTILELEFNERIGAVVDSVVPNLREDQARFSYIKNILHINGYRYFNTGVVLFKNQLIDKKEYFEKLKKLIKKGNNFLYPDQDILNIIFNKDSFLLPFYFNYQIGAFSDGLSIGFIEDKYLELSDLRKISEPVIIHYSGKDKPWAKPSIFLGFLFWLYARRVSAYEEIVYANLINSSKKSISLDRLRDTSLFEVIRRFSLFFFPLGTKRRETLKKVLRLI